MDALLEFCRTGVLGPLRKDMPVDEVERLLGAPRESKWIHGDDNWQRYRYGSLSLLLTRRHGTVIHHIKSLRVSFRRIPLDLPVAIELTEGWSSHLDDVLALLRQSDVDAAPEDRSTEDGRLHQGYRLGQHNVTLSALDDIVSDIGGWPRPFSNASDRR